jgi:hypothetical protein
MEYKAAGLATAVLLATPYSYHYDLTLLGLAALWLGVRFQQEGWRPGEAEVLLIAGLSPLLALIGGLTANVAITPFILLLLLFVLFRRVRRRYPALINTADSQVALAT